MVKILKFLAYVLFFILALMYFMPKKNVYYLVEKELQTNNIVISHEKVIDTGLSLKLTNLDVSMESIESAHIGSVDISLFGLYNTVEVKNIKLTTVASSILPVKINDVNIKYSILNPLNVTLNAVGGFGSVRGYANILDRNITLILKPSKTMKQKYRTTLYGLRKKSNGEYEYVQNF
ncbi:hypothetical protein [Sulfurimonas sp.]